MKRKYFFGILLSLFLLCGGVYLLTADIEYIDFNNQLDDVAHATDINIHIGEVYGYDTLGANITIQYGVSNSSGNFAKTHEHIVYTDTAKNSKILGAADAAFDNMLRSSEDSLSGSVERPFNMASMVLLR